MSSWKPTLAAVLLACAVVGGWSWWVKKGRPAKQEREEAAKLVFPELKGSEPGEILLRAADKPEVLLRKVEGSWKLLKPLVADVDGAQMEGLLEQLKGLKREETVVEKDADLHEFGLDKPQGAVTFKPLSPGAAAKVLFFGSNNPTGASVYAAVDGQPAVFLTPLYAKTAILKEAADLRDKALWSFETGDVERIDSTIGTGFTLQKDKEGMWQVTRPLQAPAKGEEVLSYLRTLKDTRIEKFVDEKGGADAKYGLAQGRLELKLAGKGGILVLSRGKEEGASKSRYFKVSGRPQIFTLPAFASSALEKKAEDLADNEAFKLKTWEVEKFAVVRDGKALTATKKDGAWAWDPAPEQDFDVEAFFTKAAGATVLKRLPKDAKLGASSLKLTFSRADGAQLEAIEVGDKAGGGVKVLSVAKGLVSVVDAKLFDGLPTAKK